MQDNYTTKAKHLTIDSRRLIERWKKEGAQQSYENNRKRSVKKSSLTKELKEKILHYHNQKFSPEMMVMAKGVNVGISTIYYWIHHGKLG
ncbi:IS1239%2C transposase [Streptococcus pneumoniae]|nr:IS1239%2C transposase [Streptococcus pneumoniae]